MWILGCYKLLVRSFLKTGFKLKAVFPCTLNFNIYYLFSDDCRSTFYTSSFSILAFSGALQVCTKSWPDANDLQVMRRLNTRAIFDKRKIES